MNPPGGEPRVVETCIRAVVVREQKGPCGRCPGFDLQPTKPSTFAVPGHLALDARANDSPWHVMPKPGDPAEPPKLPCLATVQAVAVDGTGELLTDGGVTVRFGRYA